MGVVTYLLNRLRAAKWHNSKAIRSVESVKIQRNDKIALLTLLNITLFQSLYPVHFRIVSLHFCKYIKS